MRTVRKIGMAYNMNIKMMAQTLHMVLFLTLLSYYLTLNYYLVVTFMTFHMRKYGHLSYYYIETPWLVLLGGICLKCYYNAATTDPGKLDNYEVPTELDEMRDIEEQEDPPDIPYCGHCNLVKVWYSHHCVICQRCVIRMDHHCPWITNCVGYYNHRFFILLPFYGFIWHIHLWIRIYTFGKVMFPLTRLDQGLSVLLLCFSLFTSFLFFSYGWMAIKGVTIIEAAERYAKIERRHEYKGRLTLIRNPDFRDNLLVVFGTRSVICSFMPVKRNLLHPSCYDF